MKVSFTLELDQKLILRILRETGKIHYPILERVLDAVQKDGLAFDAFLKIVTPKRDIGLLPATAYDSKRAQFKRTIEGLIFVGLVKQSFHLDSHFISRNYDTGLTYDDIELTSEGKRVAISIKEERLLILRPAPTQRTTVFVACAFGNDEIDQLCEKHLAPACDTLRYKPVRIDMTEPKRSITEAILEGITECACLIADLTHARPSVYFEVGFAHGLGIPMLLTCRADHEGGKAGDKKVHFDLQQYKISFWTHTSKGDFQWPSRNMEPLSRLSAIVQERKE